MSSFTLSVPKGDLSPKVIDGIIADIGRVDGSPVILDMSQVTFLTPYAVSILYNLLRYLSGFSNHVYVKLPEVPEVQTYLRRIAFIGQAGSFCDLILSADTAANESYMPKTRPSDAVLELSKVESEDDVLMILHRMNDLLKKGLGYPAKLSLAICTMVSELCQNIPQHSGDWGVVASQLYGSRGDIGDRWCKIGVSDMGLGIKASLSGTLSRDCTDAEAILAAMEAGVSRLGEIGRGQGLARVRDAVLRLRGRLTVRSGTTRVLVGNAFGHAASEPMIFRGAFFKGTHIGIELPGIN